MMLPKSLDLERQRVADARIGYLAFIVVVDRFAWTRE